MALRFLDSFDHYVTADIGSKWSIVGGNEAISAGNGRNGTSSLRITNWNTNVVQTLILDAQGTWILGFSFKQSAFPSGDRDMWAFNDGSANTHLTFQVTSAGFLQVRRGGGGGTIIGTGTIPLTAGVHNYVEIKVVISDTVGVVITKINSVTDLNLSSQDTRNAGNATVDRFNLIPGGNSEAKTLDFDDLYFCDGTGSTNNDFLGDIKVEALFPSGDGNSSQWVGSDGNSVNNSLLVDEAAPNGDTDYVTSGTPGDKDTYAFGNLATVAGTVFGVQLLEQARKDDAGARSIVSVARLAGVETDGPVVSLATTYAMARDIREAKPGGGAWAIADVNNAEFGAKVNA